MDDEMMEYRRLSRNEIARLSEIDRSEVVEDIYFYQNGELVLIKKFYQMQGFPKGELIYLLQHLELLYDQGGAIFGAFEQHSIVGIIAMDGRLRGEQKDCLMMDVIFVSKPFRSQGVGKRLVDLVKREALKLGANKLYISAIPSKNTVDFYLHLGCSVTEQLDLEFIEMDPQDIHLELLI